MPDAESYEAFIERMAGASPCEWLPMPDTDWPMPPHPGAGDEDEAEPDDKRGYEKLDA